jgi:K+-transporting ATPase KdpF subunit
VSAQDVVALVLAILLVGYLIVALVLPERF